MISERGCYPVDGSLESGPESKAQCFVSGVSHGAARPDRLTGGVRQLEVSVYSLERRRGEDMAAGQHEALHTCRLVSEYIRL